MRWLVHLQLSLQLLLFLLRVRLREAIVCVRMKVHRLGDVHLRLLRPSLVHGIMVRIGVEAFAAWICHHTNGRHEVGAVKRNVKVRLGGELDVGQRRTARWRCGVGEKMLWWAENAVATRVDARSTNEPDQQGRVSCRQRSVRWRTEAQQSAMAWMGVDWLAEQLESGANERDRALESCLRVCRGQEEQPNNDPCRRERGDQRMGDRFTTSRRNLGQRALCEANGADLRVNPGG